MLNGLVNEYNDIAIIDGNMWSFSVAFSAFALISLIIFITLHLLYLFGVLKSDWVLYANFGVGFVAFFHMSFIFLVISSAHVGAWLGLFFSSALLVLSVLWGKLSEKPFSSGEQKGKIIEYDPKTGKPIYE